MPDAFVPLAALLRAPIVEPLERSEPVVERNESSGDDADDAMEALTSDLRRFRARLAEAFERASETVLRELACSVLARELAIAPVEIVALAARAIERACDEAPIGLRACRDEAPLLQALGLPVTVDPQLRSGDLVVEVRDGELDLRLGVRLDALLGERAA